MSHFPKADVPPRPSHLLQSCMELLGRLLLPRHMGHDEQTMCTLEASHPPKMPQLPIPWHLGHVTVSSDDWRAHHNAVSVLPPRERWPR